MKEHQNFNKMSVEITIIENGPAIIQNKTEQPVTLNGELVGNKIALCRCGKSSNGIYCDGSHKKESTDKEVERKNEY